MKTFLPFLFLGLSLSAQAETVWYPLPDEAYAFGHKYPEAQGLLYAFDYGHALLYEELLLNRGKIADPAAFEKALLARIMKILKNPPTVKPSENDIAPNYTFTMPLIINMFDWSHDLHQFVYDVMVTAPDRGPQMQKRVAQIFEKYGSIPNIAFTPVCKTMLYMDGHPFSKAFRRTFPSLNLLIWSYHWLQIRLYEDLMAPTEAARDKGVAGTLKKFWNMVSDLPDSADMDDMPMSPETAPSFSAALPYLPGSFDNLHMLHDVISDILVTDRIPFDQIGPQSSIYARMGEDPNAYRASACPYHSP